MMSEAISWLKFYTGEKYNAKNLKIANFKKSDFDINAFNDYTKTAIWKKNEKLIKQKEYELYVAKRTNYPKLTHTLDIIFTVLTQINMAIITKILDLQTLQSAHLQI